MNWHKRESEMKMLCNLVILVALLFCFISTYCNFFWAIFNEEPPHIIVYTHIGKELSKVFEILYYIEALLPIILSFSLFIWVKRSHFYLSERVVGLEFDNSTLTKNWFFPKFRINNKNNVINEVFNETRDLLLQENLIKNKKDYNIYINFFMWSRALVILLYIYIVLVLQDNNPQYHTILFFKLTFVVIVYLQAISLIILMNFYKQLDDGLLELDRIEREAGEVSLN